MREHYYKIEWHPNAERQFRKIKEKSLKDQIFEIIEYQIATDPLIGKPLTGEFHGTRSFRAGVLRILYKFYKDRLVIVILSIEHRKQAYRR
jgi:addiction module RelE/StbE family toxin